MSIQEDKLAEIADAIREVDNTTEPIVANDFADRIRAISPGVKSFNGRTGDVAPADGDYTADQVGALPLTGGELSGELKIPKLTLVNPVIPERIQTIQYAQQSYPYLSIKALSTDPIIGVTFRKGDSGNMVVVAGKLDEGTEDDRIPVFVPYQPTHTNHAASKGYVDYVAGRFTVASNAGSHNGIFRGKNLGTSVTAAQYAAIAAGTFDDLFIGDYWVINGVNWRIAAFDYCLRTGSTDLTTHHVTIVPDTNLDTQKMNDSDTTSGGYVGSKMYTANIATARTKINTAFFGHVLTREFRLSNSYSGERSVHSLTVSSDVVIMNERNVLGVTLNSYEALSYDNVQFQLFSLAPEFICNREHFWLRDIRDEANYSAIGNNGTSNYFSAGMAIGVRPSFSIKG